MNGQTISCYMCTMCEAQTLSSLLDRTNKGCLDLANQGVQVAKVEIIAPHRDDGIYFSVIHWTRELAKRKKRDLYGRDITYWE